MKASVVGIPVMLACCLGIAPTLCSCGKDGKAPPVSSQAEKVVYTDSYPVAYFAERISGGLVKAVFPAPKDGDPAFWEPSESAVQDYQKADLILQNGASFAKWAEKVSLPQDKVVDTSRPFKDRFLTIQDAVTHSHGPAGQHSHEGTDFNTWVDPELAAIQAGEVAKALSKLLPERRETFEKNLSALRADLDELDAGFKTLVSKYDNQPIVASHPVYNYVARRYGWNLQSMHWEPEEMPSEEEWAKLKTLLVLHEAKWMIWEDEPSPEIAARLLKDHEVGSVVFRPCGNRPEKGDYLSVMKANLENLKPVFGRP